MKTCFAIGAAVDAPEPPCSIITEIEYFGFVEELNNLSEKNITSYNKNFIDYLHPIIGFNHNYKNI